MATENANDRLEKRIDVYPLTPSLIEKLRPSALKSQANPKLDEQVKKLGIPYRRWGYFDRHRLGSP